MVDSHVDLLSSLGPDEYYQFRALVTACILATDMSRHSDFFARTAAAADARMAALAAGRKPELMGKQAAMELLVKASDISNVVKPFAVARRWALRITDEFFLQGEAEKRLGLSVTHGFDHVNGSRMRMQTSFIDAVAEPFFDQLARAKPALASALQQLHRNRVRYERCTDDATLECDETIVCGAALA